MRLDPFIYTKYQCVICFKIGSPCLSSKPSLFKVAEVFLNFNSHRAYPDREHGFIFKHICRSCIISIARHSHKVYGKGYSNGFKEELEYGITCSINAALKNKIFYEKLKQKRGDD